MVDRNAKKYEIEKILTAPDKGIHRTRGIGGILARLWRIMLDELKVSPNRFESLLTDFITDARRAVPDNRVTLHLTRGNFRRELSNDTMTFKVFVNAMKFLKIAQFKLVLVLVHTTGRQTLHTVDVDVGSVKIKEVGKVLAQRIANEIEGTGELTHDSSTNHLIERYRAAK